MSDNEQEELRDARVRAECARELAEEAERKYQELKRKAVSKLEEDLGETSPEPTPKPKSKRARVEEAASCETTPERPPAEIPPAGPRKLPLSLTDAEALVEIYTPPEYWKDSLDTRASRLEAGSHSAVLEHLGKVASEVGFVFAFREDRRRYTISGNGPVTLAFWLTTPDKRLQIQVTHRYASKRYAPLVKTRTYLDVNLDDNEAVSFVINPDDWFFKSYQRKRNAVPRGHPWKTFAPPTIDDDMPHTRFLRFLAYAFDPYMLEYDRDDDSLPRRLRQRALKRFQRRS